MKRSSLNHIYRVVWNAALQVWQVVSEVTKGRGKTKIAKSSSTVTTLAQLLAGGALLLGGGGALAELPQNGQISAGSGQIESSGSNMVIHQSTDRMAIDWQSYNVGADHKVEYLQPSSSSIALNRVLGGDPSQIRGSLVANGRVFLVNPNGIVFGERSVIDVAGIVASTLNITNEDFMAGKFTFEGTSSGVIVNKGNVVAKQGGFVVLIAAKMENVGRLNAAGGDVLLAAGQRVRLDLGGPVKIEVEGPVVDAYIKNGGIIQADGGNVVLTVNAADQLASLAINNTGVIQARGIGMGDGGTIRLSASGQGAVESSGTIDASSEQAKGGQISIDAAKIVLSAGSVTTASGATAGGDIKLTAKEIQIEAQSVVDVSQTVTPVLAAEMQIEAQSIVNFSQKVVPSVAVPDTTAVASSSLPHASGGSIQIEADSVELEDARLDASGAEQGGSIVMSAASQTIAGSVLDVSGALAGGRIRVNAPVNLPEAPRQPQPQGPAPAPNTIVVSNSVLRSDSEHGEGGSIELTANKLNFRDDNTVSANGALGGGNIKLGGGYQGNDASTANAVRTFISAGTLITASATANGNGGEVIVWADDYTLFEGHIEAKGGALGGDGGFAEVSGKDTLAFRGTVDLTAALGEVGTLLLDPTNLTITAADNLITNPITVTSGSASIAPTGAASTLSLTTLLAALSNSNVVVTTNGSPDTGSEVGTITVASSLDYNSPYKLTLTTAPEGGVVINSNVNIKNNGFGSFEVNAGTGGVALNNSALNFAGGAVVLNSNGTLTGTGSITTTAPVDTGVASGQVRFVAAGNIDFTGSLTTTGNNNKLGQASSAGQVIVSSTGGGVVLGNILALGGNNTFNPATDGEFGGSGGQGGAVQISAGTTASSLARTIQVSAITTQGGIGKEGVGGGGGTIAITTRGTNTGAEANQIIVGTMITTGGANTLGGYNGGNAGNIIIQAARVADDSIRLQGDIAAVGGASTAPSPQGLGGNIRFKSAVKIDTVGNALSITTGATNGDVTFESTTDSYVADTAESLTITAGDGNVFFQNDVGLSASQAKELNALTVTAETITANRSITARGGVVFTASSGIVLGDSAINSQSAVINTNRLLSDTRGQGVVTLNAGTGTNRLYADLTITRGTGEISVSAYTAITATMNGGDTIGGDYDITVNGTGSTSNANGHFTISGTNGAAITNAGNVSLSKIGNLSITGKVTADNLIYQDAGLGTVNFSNRYTNDTHTYRTSATTTMANGTENAGVHGLYINTAGAITLNTGVTLSETAARASMISTAGLLHFTSDLYSNLSTNNGMIYLQGHGVTQATGSSIATINAGDQRIIIDGGAQAISLGGRLSTTNNDKVVPAVVNETANPVVNPAILIRNASNVTLTGIANNRQGTLQIGTPKAGSTLADITGNVTQNDQVGNGITIKTISAYTRGDITITSTRNNFDHTGTIELGGKLNIQSDFGGLSLLGDIIATQVRVATGGGALVLGTHNVITTPVPSSPPAGAGNATITLIGRGVTQSSNSLINAGASTVEINGRDVGVNNSSSGSIDLAGSIVTTNNTASAVRIFHSVETNSTIKIGRITASSGQVTLGTSSTALAASGSRSAAISQYDDNSDATMIIQAKDILLESRSSITLNNDNKFDNLLGVRYGGAVDIKDMDGLILMGSVSNYFANSYSSVKLETAATGGSGAALLNIKGQNITGNGITLLGQGAGSNGTLTGGVQSSGGTLNATNGAFLINAGDGFINLTGTTILTNNTSATAVQLINTGVGGNVILGDIRGWTNNASIGTLVLGGADTDNIQGTVTQSTGSVIVASSITGNSTGAVTLGNANLIRSSTAAGAFGELKAFTAGGAFVLKNAWNQGLHITGPVLTSSGSITITTGADQLWVKSGASLTSDGITLESKTANGYMTFEGNLNARAGDISLTAVGNNSSSVSIDQIAGSLITTGVLKGSGANAVKLAQTTNNVAQLGPFVLAAGDFELDNSAQTAPLTIVGNLGMAAGKLDIKSGGGIDQTAGAITAVDLRIVAGGDALLRQTGNVIGNILTVSTGGDFTLYDSTLGLTFNGGAGGASFNGNVDSSNDGNVSITTLGGSLNIATSNITATGTGSIFLTGAGITTVSTSSINAGSGTITLDGGSSAIQLGGNLTTTHNTTGSIVIRDGTSVSLSNVTSGTGGSLTLGVSTEGEGVGAVTQVASTKVITGTVSAHAVRDTARAAITLSSTDNEFTQVGSITSAALNLYSKNTGGLTWVGDVDAGGTTDIVSLGAVNIDTYNLLATGQTLNLNGVGVSQSTVIRSGASNFSTIEASTGNIQAGSGSIILLSANNDFTGTVQLSATGDDAAIRDRNGLVLASLIRSGQLGLDGPTGITAIAGTTLSLLPEAITKTGQGKVDLRTLGGNFQTSNIITTASGSINIEQASTHNADGLSVNHALTSTSGNISLKGSQVIHSNAGVLSTGGVGAIDVTAAHAATGGITMVSGTTYMAGSGGVELDAIKDIALTQVSTSGNVTMTSSAGAIRDTLNTSEINITGNIVKLTVSNGVGQSATGNQEINLSANTLVLTTDTVGIFVTNDKAVNLGDASAGAGQGEIKILTAGDLSLVANGMINTAKAISAVGSGSVHLETTGSSQDIIFGSDVTMTGGSLSLKTANGNVVQNAGAISTSGITVDAGGDVSLAQAGNDFTAAVVVKASGNVNLRDANTIVLGRVDLTTGTLTVQASGAITQSAAITEAITQAASAGAVSFNAGAGSITLTNAANEFTGAVSLNNSGAHNVAITDNSAIVLGASSVGAGTLTVNAVGIGQTGAIVQSSGAGLASFNGGAAAVNLNVTGNEFVTVSAQNTSGGITVFEKDGFAVHSLDSGSANGLTLQSGGAITTDAGQGQISAGAFSAKTLNDSGAAVSLNNAANNVASIQLQSRNAADNSNAAGTLTFVDVNGFVIEGLQTSAAAVLTAGAAVTQIGEAVVNALALKGAGSYAIDHAANQIATFASEATGHVFVASSTATTIGAVNPTGVVTGNSNFALKASSISINESINAGTGNIYLETTDASGAITQASGKGIVAVGLAIKALGNVTLTDASNNVTKFAANMLTADKTLSYRDVDGLTVANLVDVAATGNTAAGLTSVGAGSAINFNVGGLLTQEATDALINLAGGLSIDSVRSVLADVSVTNTHVNGTVLGETLIGGGYTLVSAPDEDITQLSGTDLVTGGTFAVNPDRFIGSLIYSGIASGTTSPDSIRLSGVITLSMNEGKLVATSSESGTGEVTSSIVNDPSKTITVTSLGGNPTLTNVGTGTAISLTQGNNIAGPIAINTQGTFTASSGAKPTGIIQSGDLNTVANINLVVLSSTENGGGTIDALTGEGTITLTHGNVFGGSISATAAGMNIAITDSTAMSLGNVTGSTVTLNSALNAMTQSGVITATNLLVSGAGAVTLSGANKVGTVATGSVAGFNFANAQALSVGTVSSTNGITSTGPVVLAADGLTVSEDIVSDQSVTLKPYTSATAINFGGTPTTSGQLNLTSTDMARINAGHLIVGSSDAGAITVGAITRTSDLSLINNANISITGDLSVGLNDLVLNSAGSVTQTAAMTAAGLGLLGSGSFTFTNVGNSVSTLAGGTNAQNLGALNFVNARALTVGSVNPVGVQAVGAVDIFTVAGNLTVSESISGSSVALHAGNATLAGTSTGGDVQVATGKTVTASTGNVLIYTGSLAGSTGITALVGSGSGHFRYNGDENTSYTGAGAIGTTGKFAIYRERPTISVTPNSASTPYGDTPVLSGVSGTYSGFVNGDTDTQAAITGTAVYTTTASSTSNAGSYDIAYDTGFLSAIGYAFADNSGSANEYSVAQRVISLSGSRVYNGLVTVDAVDLTIFGNVVTGQNLSLTGDGSVAEKTVGVNKAVTAGSLALGNGTGTGSGLAANYTLVGGTHALTVTPKSISASGITALDKEYDGNNEATLVTSGAGFDDLIVGDVVTLNASGVFANENVSYEGGAVVAKSVTTTGPITLSGADAVNYTITGTNPITAKITPRIVTLSASKEYDGTTALTGAQVGIGRLVTGENLTYSGATASDKNVLVGGKSISAITLGNGTVGLASNYAVPTLNAANAPVTITPKALAATLANQTKVYNGNTDAVINPVDFGLTGFIDAEDASITKTNGSFNSKDVSDATTVSVTLAASDFTPLAGTDLTNYVLPTGVSNTASSITRKSLSLSLNSLTKIYDGNADFAVGSSDYVLDGFIGAERATLIGATAVFNSKNVWEANTASLNVEASQYLATSDTGVVLNNYSLPTIAGLANAASFSITPKTVQLSATKVYDGTTDLAGRVTVNTDIGGESLNYADAQSSSKDVAAQNNFMSNMVLVDGIGSDKRNYQLPTLDAINASVIISPFVVSFTGSRTYDGTTEAQDRDLTLGTLVGNETLGLTGIGRVGDKHVADNKNVNATGLTLVDGEGEESSMGLASNYTLTGGTHQLSVTKANLTVTTSDVIKVYDTNTSANGTAVVAAGSGTQLFDNDILSGGTFAFDNKHVSRDVNTGAVLSDKTIAVSGATVNDGNSGLNYQVSYIDNTSSRIDPATLQVLGLVALDKVYDRTSAANLSTSSASLNGVLTGDNVSASSASGTFANKDVSYDGATIAAKGVVVDTMVLTGADTGNYIVAPVTGLSAKITPLGIRPSVRAQNRFYDGTDKATVLANLVLPFVGDRVEIIYDQTTALFEDSSAGLNKFVSVSGIQMTGGVDRGNYVLLTDTAVTFADITPRQLTITADDKTRVYGASDPVLTFKQSGLIDGERINVSFDAPRGPSVSLGAYSISPFGVLNPNYEVTYVKGALLITALSQPVDYSAPKSLPNLPVPSLNQTNVNSPVKTPLSDSFAGGRFNATRMSVGDLQLINITANSQTASGQVEIGQSSERVIDQAVAQVATSLRQGVQTRVLSVDGGINLED